MNTKHQHSVPSIGGLSGAQISAGLVDKNAEVFSYLGRLMGTYKGQTVPFCKLPKIVQMHFSTLYETAKKEDLKLEQTLKDQFKCKTYWAEVEQYAICNFGGFDKEPDYLLHKDPKKEYWNCGRRGKCKAEGIVCKPDCVNHNELSAREVEIIKYISEGLQAKEIADILKIGITTVRTHERNIHEKLGLNNRGEIIRFAFKNNIIF